MAVNPKMFDQLASALPNVGRDPASVRQRVEALEALLERALTLPGINRPIGLDAIVGLIPVIGDFVTAAMGSYLIWEARNLGMSKWQMARMAGHIGVDTALGAIPFVGDLFDFAYRSNSKNLRIIKKHLDRIAPADATIEGQIVSRRGARP